MKVLCTCIPAHGHFFPMVPFLKELHMAGHTVVLATAENFHRHVLDAGFDALASGLSIDQMRDRAQCQQSSGHTDLPDVAAANMFLRIAPEAMLEDLIRIISEWRPDLILHEEGEYAAPLAGFALHIPTVCIGWPAPGRPPDLLGYVREALQPLWLSFARTRPPEAAGLFSTLYLNSCPLSMQDKRIHTFGRMLSFRPIVYDGPHRQRHIASLESVELSPNKATVYVTLGTVDAYNRLDNVFHQVLDALADSDVNVIVTVGANNDISRVPCRRNMLVTDYVPQSLILPRSDVVICHGGAGSTIGALVWGRPLLIIPRGAATQQRSAAICEANGVARVLTESKASPLTVRQNVDVLIADATYRARALNVANEIGQMPHPRMSVRVLEQIASK